MDLQTLIPALSPSHLLPYVKNYHYLLVAYLSTDSDKREDLDIINAKAKMEI